jgi:digeranylgeranylglycerophospholipid reductase
MKIFVIGAGPAGLSAALNASKDGNEVLVFEKNDAVCSKICGEALAKESLDYVDVKPSKKFIVNEVQGFRISFKGEFIREAPFGNLTNAPSYLIDKPSFLGMLLNEAEEEGAKVFFNSRVEKVDPTAGKIRFQNGEIVQGDLVICADGSGSLARGHLDYSDYDTAICVQCKCSLPEGLDPKYLYLDIIGEGYVWTFIKKDYANIGLGLPRKSCSLEFVTTYLDKYLTRLGVKPLGKTMSAPVAIGGPIKSFETGKLIAVGEAAGCVMPLSGEGNRFGIYSGSIAYKPNYRAKFMEKYGRNMEMSRKIFEFVQNLTDDERVEFLKFLNDPLEILEGKRPKMSDFFLRPKLLMKLMHSFLF